MPGPNEKPLYGTKWIETEADRLLDKAVSKSPVDSGRMALNLLNSLPRPKPTKEASEALAETLKGFGTAAGALSNMGISAQEAAVGFQALAGVLGRSPRDVVLTRRKSKNRPGAKIKGKDIHGGSMETDAKGNANLEVLVHFETHYLYELFKPGDRVAMKVQDGTDTLRLQITDMKKQLDGRTLISLSSHINPTWDNIPETEEECLDIFQELNQ